MKSRITEIMFLTIVLPTILILGFMSLSLETQDYIKDIILLGQPNIITQILNPFIYLFIVFYATPAYIVLFIIKKLAEALKFKNISAILSLTFMVASIPLNLLAYGFWTFSTRLGARETKEKAMTFLSSLISVILILTLQLRQFHNAFLALISISIFFYIVGFIIERKQKSD